MRIRPLLLALSLLVGACASSRAPMALPPPNLEIVVSHQTRSTFRRGGAEFPPPVPEDFNSIVVAFHAIERIPEDLLDPVTDHAQLFLQSGRGDVLLPAPRLVAGARVGFGSGAEAEVLDAVLSGRTGRHVEIGRATGIVARGTTATMDVRKLEPTVQPHLWQEVRESMFLDLSETPTGDGYLFSVGVRRIVKPEPRLSTAGLSVESQDRTVSEKEADSLSALRIEAFTIDLKVEESPWAIVAVVPAGYLDEEIGAIAMLILISAPPAAFTPARLRHDETIDAFDHVAARRRDQEAREALASPVKHRRWSGFESALDALENPESARGAFAWLARETGARLGEDVSLTATDPTVAMVVARAIEFTKDLPRPVEQAPLGLKLEQATYEVLFEYIATRDAPPVAVGFILRHSGDVGRNPTVLEEIVADASSLEELRRELERENVILLEDSSPAARVRACDWLALQGVTVPDYDPLAPRDQRREAMNRYLENLTRETGAGETGAGETGAGEAEAKKVGNR